MALVHDGEHGHGHGHGHAEKPAPPTYEKLLDNEGFQKFLNKLDDSEVENLDEGKKAELAKRFNNREEMKKHVLKLLVEEENEDLAEIKVKIDKSKREEIKEAVFNAIDEKEREAGGKEAVADFLHDYETHETLQAEIKTHEAMFEEGTEFTRGLGVAGKIESVRNLVGDLKAADEALEEGFTLLRSNKGKRAAIRKVREEHHIPSDDVERLREYYEKVLNSGETAEAKKVQLTELKRALMGKFDADQQYFGAIGAQVHAQATAGDRDAARALEIISHIRPKEDLARKGAARVEYVEKDEAVELKEKLVDEITKAVAAQVADFEKKLEIGKNTFSTFKKEIEKIIKKAGKNEAVVEAIRNAALTALLDQRDQVTGENMKFKKAAISQVIDSIKK